MRFAISKQPIFWTEKARWFWSIVKGLLAVVQVCMLMYADLYATSIVMMLFGLAFIPVKIQNRFFCCLSLLKVAVVDVVLIPDLSRIIMNYDFEFSATNHPESLEASQNLRRTSNQIS